MVKQKKRPVAYAWDGPLPERDVPDGVLYAVVLRFHHEAGTDAPDALSDLLAPRFGKARRFTLPVMGTRLRWKDGNPPMDARIRNGTIELRLEHRVKGRTLQRIVDDLAQVPGAFGLTIEAQAPYFTDGAEDVRACTPCMASKMPAKVRR